MVIALTIVTTLLVGRLRKRWRALRRTLPLTTLPLRKSGTLPRSASLLQDYLRSTLDQSPRRSAERTASTLLDELLSIEMTG